MQHESYYPLGQIGGAEVGVPPTLDGQNILIEHCDSGQRLACLLAMGQTDIVRRGDALHWRVHHNREADRLLMEVTDLFISIRYAHPTLVQLEMELDEPAP